MRTWLGFVGEVLSCVRIRARLYSSDGVAHACDVCEVYPACTNNVCALAARMFDMFVLHVCM